VPEVLAPWRIKKPEYGVRGELAEPFDTILSNELRVAAAIKAEEDLREVIEQARRNGAGQDEADNAQRPQEPEHLLVGAGGPPAPSFRGGCDAINLVRMRGLEPPPGCPDTDLNRARLPIPPHPPWLANIS
jgi:hypothetical protein